MTNKISPFPCVHGSKLSAERKTNTRGSWNVACYSIFLNIFLNIFLLDSKTATQDNRGLVGLHILAGSGKLV